MSANVLRADVPIIGQRDWGPIGFMVTPIAEKPPLELHSAETPIVGFAISIQTQRSDRLPVRLDHFVEVKALGENPAMGILQLVSKMFDNLESFRNCQCRDGEMCLPHRRMFQTTPS